MSEQCGVRKESPFQIAEATYLAYCHSLDPRIGCDVSISSLSSDGGEGTVSRNNKLICSPDTSNAIYTVFLNIPSTAL